MSKPGEHNKIIAAAAKAALTPLGCKRVGRSRVWTSDQRYWAIDVEFQPSGWSKGSYLNVAVQWLWSGGYGWNLFTRPMFFVPFETPDQFKPAMACMAECAAQEVIAMRQRFATFADIVDWFAKDAIREGWPIYHAAVATALAGDIVSSRRYFDRLAVWPTYGYEFQLRLKARSAALAELLSDRAQFRAAILEFISQARTNRKLPPDPNCLDFLDSQAAR